MKPCIYLKKQIPNKIAGWSILAFTLFGFLFFLFVAVKSMMVQAWLFCLIFGVLHGYIAIPFCLINTTKYRVVEKGIEVGGPLRRTKLYIWNQIYSIGVYAYGSNAGLNGYFSGICVFLKPVPAWFSSGAIKSSLMTARWARTMIRIDYSLSVLNELSAVYHGEIHDYRDGQIKGYRATRLR